MDLSPNDDPLTRTQTTLDAVLADQQSMRQAINQAALQQAPQHMLNRQRVSAAAPSQFSHPRQPQGQ